MADKVFEIKLPLGFYNKPLTSTEIIARVEENALHASMVWNKEMQDLIDDLCGSLLLKVQRLYELSQIYPFCYGV